MRLLCWASLLGLLLACTDDPPADAGRTDASSDVPSPDGATLVDTPSMDGSSTDGSSTDGVSMDGGAMDGVPMDGGAMDTGNLCEGVVCPDGGAACEVQQCDPMTGTCASVELPDGTSCDDDAACTQDDICTGGVCAGTSMDCSALDDECQVGICDPATTTCRADPVADGTGCDDAHPCTSTDSCTGGICGGTLRCREPTGLTRTGPTTELALRGNEAGGTPRADSCPNGNVLVGIRGRLAAASYIGQLQGICAPLVLTGSGLGPYAFTTGTRVNLPTRGTEGSTMYESVCPTGEAVVGFRGRAAMLVDQLQLLCAPLEVTESPTEFRVASGVSSFLPPVGSAVGGTPFPTTECSPGTVATVAQVRSGSAIDAFTIRCQTISLTYPAMAGAKPARDPRSPPSRTQFALAFLSSGRQTGPSTGSAWDDWTSTVLHFQQ